METSSPTTPKPASEETVGTNVVGGRITSAQLLQGRRQVEIEHAGELYRLRITKAGKLILTK